MSAQRTATSALQALAAYEEAFAMTVPPPVIAANRALLASLVATNFLGINTPAILETEMHYMEMWAQDVTAMIQYAASSQATTQQLPTFNPAPEVAKPTVIPTPAVTTGNVAPTVSTTSSSLSSILSSPLVQILAGYGENFVSSGVYSPVAIISALTGGHDFFPGQYPNVLADTPRNVGIPGGPVATPTAVTATVGRATSLGSLSVPPGWAQAAGTTEKITLASNVAPLSPESGAAGYPGMPLGATGSRGYNNAPKYGRKLTVVTHSPAGG